MLHFPCIHYHPEKDQALCNIEGAVVDQSADKGHIPIPKYVLSNVLIILLIHYLSKWKHKSSICDIGLVSIVKWK